MCNLSMFNNMDCANYADEITPYFIGEVRQKHLTLWKMPEMISFAGLWVIKWKPILISVI